MARVPRPTETAWAIGGLRPHPPASLRVGIVDMLTGEIQIRVRYAETDRMGLLHHANYLVYFEQARTELLRARGRRTRTWKIRATFW